MAVRDPAQKKLRSTFSMAPGFRAPSDPEMWARGAPSTGCFPFPRKTALARPALLTTIQMVSDSLPHPPKRTALHKIHFWAGRRAVNAEAEFLITDIGAGAGDIAMNMSRRSRNRGAVDVADYWKRVSKRIKRDLKSR
jgi:hypothetical protein